MTQDSMPVEETWRYEIRGSMVYDKEDDRLLTLFEVADRLNEETRLHAVNLQRAGEWAAKAGLAEGNLNSQAQRLREAEEEKAIIQKAYDESYPPGSLDHLEWRLGETEKSLREAEAALELYHDALLDLEEDVIYAVDFRGATAFAELRHAFQNGARVLSRIAKEEAGG